MDSQTHVDKSYDYYDLFPGNCIFFGMKINAVIGVISYKLIWSLEHISQRKFMNIIIEIKDMEWKQRPQNLRSKHIFVFCL